MNSRTNDWTYNINNQNQVVIEVGGWDRVTIQAVAPIVATAYLYGSLDAGAVQGVTQGNAALATNFTPIQATNLATGSAVSSITAAGLYEFEVRSKFLKIAGGGVSIYKLLTFETKPY